MELSEMKTAPSEAHPDTMDFLSKEWCNFAVQALQPDQKLHDRSLVVLENSMKIYEGETSPVSFPKMDDSDFKSSVPPWKSTDVKSWIRMQQAMHPELNYNGYFRKKFKMPWKVFTPIKAGGSIQKWWKEIKSKRKEEERLQKAEVHAAVSVAGLAAALAAIAADKSRKGGATSKEDDAVATAAAIVAAQCAKVAEAMGAKKQQLGSVIGSAVSGSGSSEIVTLTAAATTSLRGAATLKARAGCKMNRLNGSAPVLPIEDSSDFPLEFEKNRSILAKGVELGIETPDGDFKFRSVSIILDGEGKVILKLRKRNLLKSKKKSVVMDLHVELYKDPESENIEDTCYLLVLKTAMGTVKLDLGDDYHRYKTWVTTINHMLLISASVTTKYQLQFSKN